MKLGLIYPQTELQGDPEAVGRIALAAEGMGFDYLLAYDHVLGASHDREPRLTGPYTEHQPFHDPLVMFAYAAAITQRIEFATGILILPQRQTALVARQAADVDLLSQGRLTLGVGTGWNYVEYDALGQDFATRGQRLEEQVTLLRRLWSEPLLSFEGRFDQVDRVALNPRPRRRIPILLGGFVDVALRRAARIGDGFIFADGAADAFAQTARLRELLDQAGRSGEPFELRCNMLRARTPGDIADTARRWADIGGSHVAVSTMGLGHASVEQHIDYAAEALAALKARR
ncbi:LLM class F420-dependent oxidoreductase [Novosphingobium album (ex Liu et al. 2023)]|uniref:LLM class F420-dependent oxidoreductase n=1 Tax=Novosphingobium album (ex Liu et al. 2023) TaxID=3031130 RepID=A0ABT5WT45_9SPHN|nr:LLM class F420-dependent oxidoreductase [Novosphingobium album (ex Liu et al. 2023)]MDE8652213.1 LLM class F420-dependent oxidoreductase [Novosphingobium album (ex Liu et al. 2023)]